MLKFFYALSISTCILSILISAPQAHGASQSDLSCLDFSTVVLGVEFTSENSLSGESLRRVSVTGIPGVNLVIADCVMNTVSQDFDILDLARCTKTVVAPDEDPTLAARLPIEVRLERKHGEIRGAVTATGAGPYPFSCGEKVNPWAPQPNVIPVRPEEPIKFSRIQPILKERCATCHSGLSSGPAHSQLNLADLNTVVRMKNSIIQRLEAGIMPKSDAEFRFTPKGQLLLQWLLYDGTSD